MDQARKLLAEIEAKKKAAGEESAVMGITMPGDCDSVTDETECVLGEAHQGELCEWCGTD